ncbi:hypothetical protein M9Y10_035362 [Tritrichomonas musculus]|uniref:HECT domain-containing protein n=1 Tax=Tritrichomonas musculus TaxID=1915356 RepID=A0ABR2KHN3_9EUKA
MESNLDSIYIEESSNDASFEQNNDFFQVEFDNLIVSSNFTSDLFDQSPETAEQQLIIPQGVSIVDFLNDPVAFAAASSSEIVWSSIISPILSGKPETKPYMLQLITSLFKYFKDHPIPFIENEMNRRNEIIEATNRERNALIESHYTENKIPIPNYSDFISRNFEKEFSLSPQTNFFEVTHRLYLSATENLTERHTFALFKWGMFSEDISSIIYSLSFFGQLLSLQKKNSRISLDFSIFKDTFYGLPLNNAYFHQSLQTPMSSTEIFEYIPPMNTTSFASCDASNIYVLDSNGSITRINLSTEIIDKIERFTKIDITANNPYVDDSRISIATSNGYAVILDHRIKPLLYKLPNFEFVSELNMSQNQRLTLPITSDGFYIYSFQMAKKKLNVFTLNSNGCTFIKSVTIQFNEKKHLFAPKQDLVTFCNGSLFTIAFFEEKVNNAYKYVFCHFSLIDGRNVGEEIIKSKWEILSMINYPWDRKVFEIGKYGQYRIFKLPNYSSQPPWLSKSGIIDSTFVHELSTAKRVKDAFFYVLCFLSFYSFNFNGYSFRAFINNQNYLVKSSQFFSPCTNEVISTLIKTIIVFIHIFYTNESKSSSSPRSPLLSNENYLPKEWSRTVMFTLFRLLELNLANFENRQGKEGRGNISIDCNEGEIIDLFLLIKNNKELHYLLPMVIFIITNCFSLLFKNPSKRHRELFVFLYDFLINDDDRSNDDHSNDDLLFYMTKQISNYPEFAYSLSLTEIRAVFPKLLQKLKSDTIKYCQKEFLYAYMRSVMLEMNHTYSTFQGKFTPKETQLENSFHCFSTIVVEAATPFFATLEYDEKKFDEEKFDKIPFVIFFKKWLALLEPFPQFNRASLLITSFIQPIDRTISQMIKDKHISCDPILNEKRFHKLSMIFYEMFSLFVNSISALLDGGAEIKEVCQYEWLVQSAKKENVNITKISNWVRKIDSNVGVKTIGISFQCKESMESIESPVDRSELAFFINELIRVRNPTESIDKLMNYLHQKVKNPMNSKLTNEEKRIERIILAALIKQLGLTRELYEVRILLEKQSNPVISHLVRQTMTVLYRIRNQIRLSKQMTAQLQNSNSNYENYNNFITEIRMKTAFLLNIEPWLRNNQTEKDFTEMLKQLQVFITSKISISQYLEIIDSAITSSETIKTGIAFLSSKLIDCLNSRMNVDKVCSSYMIERLFSNDSIHYYLSTLGKGFLQNDVAKIVDLFPLLIDMIKNKSIEVSLYPIIVFFMNTSITHFAKDSIFNNINELINIILNSSMSNHEINSMMVFIASALLNLIELDNSMINNESLKKIFNKFVNQNELNENNLPLEEISLKGRMKKSEKIDELISIFSNGSPVDYHIASLIIYDIIVNNDSIENKINIIYQIILTISQSVSGCESVIMKSFPYFNLDFNHVSFVYKYAPLIISGCSELIQICRKLLSQNDEEMKNVIFLILNNNFDLKNKNFYSKFLNNKLLLFGVFAILSNLIEEIHPNSLIKNTKTNQIYYIVSINNEELVSEVWQLPINSNSVQFKINLTSDFVPISLMPFQVNLFNDYSLLIPYFIDALNGKLNSGLSILVLASLREFSMSSSFLKEFIKFLHPKSLLSYIDYTNSLPFYLKLLHSHLNQKSNGFFEKIINDDFLLFNVFNPNQSFQAPISTENINNGNILLLISSVFQVDSNFNINIKISCQNYDVGVFCPSLAMNTDHLFYSKRADEVTPVESILITNNKLMGVAIIVKTPRKKSTYSKKIEKPFCLILNLLSVADVDFKLVKSEEDESNEAELTLDAFKRNEISSFEIENSYVGNTFMSIPYNILSSLPSSLSIPSEPINNDKKSPIFYNIQEEINNWQRDKNKIELPKNEKIYKCISKSENSVLYSINNNVIWVNKFNGKSFIFPFQEIETTTCLPYINLFHFPILPSSITNYYSTGISYVCRNEILNWIFINLVTSSNTIPFEETMKLFNITEKDLIKHILNLISILEPVFKNVDPSKLIDKEDKTTEKYSKTIEKVQIIDFDYNGLDQGSELRMTSLQIFSSAMLHIIEYIDKKNIQNEFADNWFNLLQDQFLNGFAHSCIPPSTSGTSSVFINMNSENSPYIISRPDVLGWIVCDVGFSSVYVMVEKCTKNDSRASKIIRCHCKINKTFITDPLTVILKPTLNIEFKKKNKTIVLIPIISNSNDTLIGSFYDLALSFKYFVYYITMKKSVLKKCQYYKTQIYSLFFKAIVSKSPFFFTYMSDIFTFLHQRQELQSSDIEGEFVLSLNLLSFYCCHVPQVFHFLSDVSELWNDKIVMKLAAFFPDFMTDDSKKEIQVGNDTSPEFLIPVSRIPDAITTNDTNLHSIIHKTKRVLKKFDSIEGYPYHILLQEWAKVTMLYPPYDVKVISPHLTQITFTHFTPERAAIRVKPDQKSLVFKIYDNINMSNEVVVKEGDVFPVGGDTIYIGCEKSDISVLDFVIISPHRSQKVDDDEKGIEIPIESFIYDHRSQFTSDIRTFCTTISSRDDQQILFCFSDKVFKKKKTLTFEVLTDDPMIFTGVSRSLHMSLNVIILRAKFLIILNWLVSTQTDLIETDPEIRSLLPSISVTFKLSLFNEEINKLSYDKPQVSLCINRKEAMNVRLGSSTDLKRTIVSQMSYEYQDPTKYRCKSDKPWKVRFVNEIGIDAGGLARELVNECAVDFMCPLCGLVVPVPNAANEVGQMDDLFIPIPSPKHDQIRIEKMYQFCGALIAICIRTGLVQQFLFPPLVWEYLLTGHLSIQRVFEIDKNYEMLITSLTEALKSDMTNDEFIERFNLKFVVLNSVGVEVPLSQRGKSIVVDKSNCNEFIACANRFRINELESNLKYMKDGFWSNLGIKPLPFIDWQTLEFAACGQSELSVNMLKNITEFSCVDQSQQDIFWAVVESFSPKERSDLLKFATGRVRLPPKRDMHSKFLIVDKMSGYDVLPTASTCFHKLHYPFYSSVEKASKMIKIAIEYSGTFENS